MPWLGILELHVLRRLGSTATRLGRKLRDALLLKHPEAVVRDYSPARQAVIRQLYQAAMARIALADETTDARYAAAAVALHREAVRFLISAILLSQDATLQGVPLALRAGADKLEELVQAGALPALPKRYAETMSILDAPDLLALDRLRPRRAVRDRALVETLVQWLRRQVEPRSLRRIRATRTVRLVLAGAVLLGLIAWGLVSILSAKNIALHKRVTMSSQYPGTPNPQGATDGRVVAPYQAHTAIESDPWIAVDLGAVRKISTVKIYNRTDWHYESSLPLTLEFSKNRTDYYAVDRRTVAFTGSKPWVFTPRASSARFVRVHGHPGGCVVLTEIKVYGH
jgi:hypothetical protein